MWATYVYGLETSEFVTYMNALKVAQEMKQ